MRVVEHNWSWAKPLAVRSGAPAFLVVHHAAGDMTAEAIHRAHRAQGWSGIGYHYVVQLDGSVHRGRPEGRVGAHVAGHNSGTLGVCFSGNYETRKAMPAKQLAAGRELLADLRRRYPKAKVRRHGDFNPTACPGRYFPLNELLKGGSVALPLVDTGKRALLKERMLWYAINNGLSLRDARVGIVTAQGKANNAWGDAAKTLAWRVSGHLPGFKQSTQPSAALMRALRG